MSALEILARHVKPSHIREQEYPGLVHMGTEFHDHTRWSIHYLDVYYHAPSDTYAGVTFSVGATEMQDDPDNAEIVAVEHDPTPHFRIRRTPR
jgi:hypothetical protein